MRIVLDTNILVRANPKALPSGLARELLLTAVSGPHTLILSTPILVEVDRVLRYPHVQARWRLTEDAIGKYVTLLESVALIIELPVKTPQVLSDPDDDPILQTAIAGAAQVLCTRDKAFGSARVTEVCRAHGIRLMSDLELIQELRQQ